jgi:hypothetical protein
MDKKIEFFVLKNSLFWIELYKIPKSSSFCIIQISNTMKGMTFMLK